jgi:hypothetical protein
MAPFVGKPHALEEIADKQRGGAIDTPWRCATMASLGGSRMIKAAQHGRTH